MRPDGKRVKDLPPIVAAIPYIMPKRYEDVYKRQARRPASALSSASRRRAGDTQYTSRSSR